MISMKEQIVVVGNKSLVERELGKAIVKRELGNIAFIGMCISSLL